MTHKKKFSRFRRSRALNVVPYPNPLLKSVCPDIDPTQEPGLHALIDDMIKTMYKEDGVGLAAIQVGVAQNFFVYDDTQEGDNPRVLINPRIISYSDTLVTMDEGCLSFPGIYIPIERPDAVVVEACDIEGNALHLEADEFTARLFQHEIDHLQGKVMLDRATPKVRREVMREHYMGN